MPTPPCSLCGENPRGRRRRWPRLQGLICTPCAQELAAETVANRAANEARKCERDRKRQRDAYRRKVGLSEPPEGETWNVRGMDIEQRREHAEAASLARSAAWSQFLPILNAPVEWEDYSRTLQSRVGAQLALKEAAKIRIAAFANRTALQLQLQGGVTS